VFASNLEEACERKKAGNMSGFIVRVDAPPIPEISIVEFIQQVIGNISSQIGALDTEINMASQGDQGQVRALSAAVNGIKASAEQTTSILKEILEDKNKLEVAIARLEGPGQTLLQLTKLVELVKALEEELKGDPQEVFGYFSGVAELLTDVRKHVKKFEAYSSTPQLVSVSTRVQCIQSELERMVQWRVREIGPLLTTDDDGDMPSPPGSAPSSSSSVSPPRSGPGQGQSAREKSNSSVAAAANLEVLSQVSDLVDVLGDAFRKDLLVRFAQLQLIAYEKLFCSGTRYCGAEHVERRYAWFRRLCKAVDSKVSEIFPAAWMLPVFLFAEFVRRTKNHLAEALASSPHASSAKSGSQEETKQIARLLASIRSVLTFEKEMMGQFSQLAKQGGGSIEGIVKESIAEAFDEFMGPWISSERTRLDELLERLNKEEVDGKAPAPMPGTGIEYNSSREMFAYIKASLARCTEFSRGQTYLAMSREYRVCLGKYVEKLRFRLPLPEIPKPGRPPAYSVNNAAEYRLCRIVTTCVYCINTVPKLEDIMRESVKPEFQEAVHFTDEVDAFESLLDAALTVVNAGTVNRMEEALRVMRHTDWTRIDHIGDDSKYVRALRETLAEAVPRLRKHIPAERFLLVCRKLSEAVLEALRDNIYRLKRIAKIGAEQLKMDLHGVKEYLLRLPTVKQAADAEATVINKAYSATINARFTEIQNILKLVSAEDENVPEIFALLWPNGTQAELDAIVALRSKQGGMIPSLPSAGVGKAAKDLTSGMKSALSDMLHGGGLFGSDETSKRPSSSSSSAQQAKPSPKPKPAAAPAKQPAPKAAPAPAPAAASASAGGVITAAAATQRILAFYQKQDPSKVEHIKGLLSSKYKGKEAELLSKVQAQYPSAKV